MIDVNLINGIALAFEGDAVYSMYIRRHLILKGMTKPNKLHQEATKYVSAKAQARLISLMLEEQVLTEKEEEIYKRGRNTNSHLSKAIITGTFFSYGVSRKCLSI